MGRINTADLSEIFDKMKDVLLISQVQRGSGAGLTLLVVLRAIIETIVYIIVFALLFMVLRWFYKIIVSGYYRPGFIFMRWYHKENTNKIMTEKDVLFKHFLILSKTNWEGVNPFIDIIKGNAVTAHQSAVSLNSKIGPNSTYFEVKGMPKDMDRLIRTVERYYLYNEILLDEIKDPNYDVNMNVYLADGKNKEEFQYQLIEIQETNPDPKKLKMTNPSAVQAFMDPNVTKVVDVAGEYFIITRHDWRFYSQLYKILNAGKDYSDKREVLQLYYYDNTYYYTRRKDLPSSQITRVSYSPHPSLRTKHKDTQLKILKDINNMSAGLFEVAKSMNDMSSTFLLTIPYEAIQQESLVAQLQKYDNVLYTDAIYSNRYRSSGTISVAQNKSAIQLDEYTWYIIESLREYRYSDLEAIANQYVNNKPYMKALITAYLSMPVSRRTSIFYKVPQSFPAELLPMVTAQPNDTPMDVMKNRVLSFVEQNIQLFTWFDKHPIFSHVYFNSVIDQKSRGVYYADAISLYRKLFLTNSNKTMLQVIQGNTEQYNLMVNNLVRNGKNYKEAMNSIVILNLYFNVYKEDLSRMIRDQNITQDEFQKRLFNIYVEKTFTNTIVKRALLIFSWSYIKNRYRNYEKLFAKLGKMIQDAKKEITKGFKPGSFKETQQTAIPGEDPKSAPNPGADPGV
jgi:hypothetical protein